MKVAIAQITTDPGAFESNIKHIKSYIDQARAQQVKLLVFPEGCVQGYAHMDLVLEPSFVKATRVALYEIAKSVQEITVVIGFVNLSEDLLGPNNKPVLYNSAAVLHAGSVQNIINKILLPDYDIFSERRYFTAGKQSNVITIEEYKTGIGICEDLWSEGYATHVYPNFITESANLLINISASPFHINKPLERKNLIERLINKQQISFIYANSVGSYDGYDGEIVFDGRSMIWNSKGELCAVANGFKEQLLCADLEQSAKIEFTDLDQSEQLYQALIFGIREYYRRCSFKKAYIGLSGGIDSAVVAALAVAALGKENVIAVTMPSEITSTETLNDALELAQRLAIQIDQRPIKNEYQAWLNDFKKTFEKEPERLTLQNKQARIRGSILMEYSNQDASGLVLTTGNKTELALGYCTLYGDMCGGLAVISDVSKERVYLLAKYINKIHKQSPIPASIITRIPTAELEPGQTDAANLPADYDIMSPLVDDIVERQLTSKELESRYPSQVVDQTMRLIRINEFKRRQAAPGIRVTPKAFGIGRRIPIG